MIVNCISFLTQSDLLTSCNDCTVKIWDLQQMKPKSNMQFKEPINIAQVSPDGNLLGVYGDCIQAEILDMRSGKLIASIFGHDDFGFSLAWHPSGKLMATGNQDKTCKIWDLRYIKNFDQSFSCEPYCLKTIDCLVGASAHIKFIGSDKMAFSETIDHIQVFDTATFTEHQDIDMFGEITGFDVYGNKMYIGVKEDPNLSCIMEYQENRHEEINEKVAAVNSLIL